MFPFMNLNKPIVTGVPLWFLFVKLFLSVGKQSKYFCLRFNGKSRLRLLILMLQSGCGKINVVLFKNPSFNPTESLIGFTNLHDKNSLNEFVNKTKFLIRVIWYK